VRHGRKAPLRHTIKLSNNMETPTHTATPVALDRLVRRCAAYNAIHATEFTPESYDEERTRVPRLIAWDEGWEACEKLLTPWEEELSKVMPPDFKDWWQNDRSEWPLIARLTIESLREREELAWSMLPNARAMPPAKD